MGTTRSPSVFISYMHEDKGTVRELARNLVLAGVEVWWDEERLKPGHTWRQEIHRAIAKSDIFLACFSASFERRQDSFMKDELAEDGKLQELCRGDMQWII